MSLTPRQEKELLKKIPRNPSPKKKIKFKNELLANEKDINRAYQARSEKEFMTFIRGLTIDGQYGARVFENCMAPFQREFFEDIAPSLHAVRDGEMPPIRRWWMERTKKASKDADMAAIMCWMIAFPIKPLYFQVGAADKEQAAIVKERMVHLLHWNDWLNSHIEIVKWEVRSKKRLKDGSPMAKLDIMSSDLAGAHGGTPDILIINELSHVTKYEYVENLMDNADGVAQGLVMIATNAGFKGTKAEVWRNNAISNDVWGVHMWAKPAPWHSLDAIRDAKRRNPYSRYNRLWQGVWQSGRGEALNEEDIDRCFVLDGPTIHPEPGWEYVAGLDLGISHDHSGLMVLGVNYGEQKLKTVYWQGWAPHSKSGEVDLIAVEASCLAASRNYNLRCLLYDPHQAKLMAQRLTREGVLMREMSFSSPGNLSKMATSLIQVVETRKIEMYDDEDGRLRKDLSKFDIVEKTYGFKLEATSDEFGHADVGTALAICVPTGVEMLDGFRGINPDDVLAPEDDSPLSDEEVENMPQGLREIMEEEAGTEIEQSLKDIYGE